MKGSFKSIAAMALLMAISGVYFSASSGVLNNQQSGQDVAESGERPIAPIVGVAEARRGGGRARYRSNRSSSSSYNSNSSSSNSWSGNASSSSSRSSSSGNNSSYSSGSSSQSNSGAGKADTNLYGEPIRATGEMSPSRKAAFDGVASQRNSNSAYGGAYANQAQPTGGASGMKNSMNADAGSPSMSSMMADSFTRGAMRGAVRTGDDEGTCKNKYGVEITYNAKTKKHCVQYPPYAN